MDERTKYDKPAEHELTARQHEYDRRDCELLVAKGNDVKPFRIDMFDIIKVMDTITRVIKFGKIGDLLLATPRSRENPN